MRGRKCRILKISRSRNQSDRQPEFTFPDDSGHPGPGEHLKGDGQQREEPDEDGRIHHQPQLLYPDDRPAEGNLGRLGGRVRVEDQLGQALKYFVYTPNNDSADDYYDATSHYQEFKFESGKSFSNVFYPEKDDVVKRLDFFSKNKEWYKKRGIPYTMGFLFYGAPGCGKTSTIKAIANHTQRHIVSVPLNKIK